MIRKRGPLTLGPEADGSRESIMDGPFGALDMEGNAS